jgi:chlorobactene glucosyltransferase
MVSIIVPAKDEEDTIELCLTSLLNLEYRNKEIIVVCGKSKDRTEEIVKRFPVKIVYEVDSPPEWVGKNWACHLGFQNSTGELLLFTDGDVFHEPESLSSAVEFMKKNKVDLLSCWPKIITRSFWESVVLPIGYFLLSTGIATFARTKTSFGTSVKGANGQFILIKRDSYIVLGGHESVREEVLEDAALGRRAVDNGLNVMNVRAEELLKVYPYKYFNELKSAFQRFGAAIIKNKYLLLGVILAHLLYFVAPLSLVLLVFLYPASLGQTFKFLSIFSFLIAMLSSAYFYNLNSRLLFFISAPLGALIACFLYSTGYIKGRKEGIMWKGRLYTIRRNLHPHIRA